MAKKIQKKKPEVRVKTQIKNHEDDTSSPSTSAYDEHSKYKPYGYHNNQVPIKMRVPYILTRYRFPGLSVEECICSLVQPHNELINVWTHLIALIAFLFQIYPLIRTVNPFQDPIVFPLFFCAFGICLMFVVSSCSHLFNSISPYAYHVCYFFDYAAISFVAYIFAQTIFFYTRPLNTSMTLFDSPEIFLSLVLVNSLICTFICCSVLVKRPWYHIFVRITAYSSLFMFAGLPYFAHAALCALRPTQDCTPLLMSPFRLEIVCIATAAFTYALRIPERLAPRMFDLLGQSHHVLHVMSAIGISQMFLTLHRGMVEQRKFLLKSPVLWGEISGIFTAISLVLNFGIVLWFSITLYSRQQRIKLKEN